MDFVFGSCRIAAGPAATEHNIVNEARVRSEEIQKAADAPLGKPISVCRLLILIVALDLAFLRVVIEVEPQF